MTIELKFRLRLIFYCRKVKDMVYLDIDFLLHKTVTIITIDSISELLQRLKNCLKSMDNALKGVIK